MAADFCGGGAWSDSTEPGQVLVHARVSLDGWTRTSSLDVARFPTGRSIGNPCEEQTFSATFVARSNRRIVVCRQDPTVVPEVAERQRKRDLW